MALTTRVGLEFIGKDRSRGAFTSVNRSLMQFSRQVMYMAGIGGGLYGLQRMVRGVTEAYMQQEKAEMDLAAALRNTGAEVNENLDYLKKYAAEIQKQTIYGDEMVLSQMAYAANLGVTADKLDEAAKAGVGLAARFRLDLASAMMLIGRASQGQTQLLTRYGIVLDAAMSDQEKFNELLRIGADAYYLAQAETQTLTGQLKQLGNEWGDIKETMGAELSEPFLDLIQAIKDNHSEIEWFLATLIKGFGEIIRSGETLKSVADIINIKTQQAGMQNTGMPGSWAPMPGSPGRPAEGAAALPPHITGVEYGLKNPAGGMAAIYGEAGRMDADKLRYVEEMKYRTELVDNAAQAMADNWRQLSQDEIESAAHAGTVTTDMLAGIKEKVRDHIQAVRYMEGATTREKIMMIEDYRTRHAAILEQVKGAEKMLLDEILRYERSRVDAMAAYRDELRDDMERSGLFLSEKWAQAFQSIESSMGNAFYSMMAEGASFKEAMVGFATDIGRAFARMAAEVTARVMMAGMFGNTPLAPFLGIQQAPVKGSKQSGGAIHETGLYYMHKGENVIPPGGMSVKIINPPGMPLKAASSDFNGRDLIVSLVMEDYDGGGPVRDMIDGRRG